MDTSFRARYAAQSPWEEPLFRRLRGAGVCAQGLISKAGRWRDLLGRDLFHRQARSSTFCKPPRITAPRTPCSLSSFATRALVASP